MKVCSLGWIYSSVGHVSVCMFLGGRVGGITYLFLNIPLSFPLHTDILKQGWLWVGDLLLLPVATQQMTGCRLLSSFIRKKNGREQLGADRTFISAVIMHKASTCLLVALPTVLGSGLCGWMELWSLLFEHEHLHPVTVQSLMRK